MFVIGIDPHRGRTPRRCSTAPRSCSTSSGWSLIAANVNGCWSGRRRSRRGCGRSKAPPAPVRCWPSSSSPPASDVLDVPPTLSARVRLLDSGRSDKTDSHDAAPPRWWRCATVAAAGARRGPRRRAAAAGQAPPRPGRGPDPGGVPAAHDAVSPGRRPFPQADDRPPGRRHPRPHPADATRCRWNARPWPVTCSPRSAASTETWPTSRPDQTAVDRVGHHGHRRVRCRPCRRRLSDRPQR